METSLILAGGGAKGSYQAQVAKKVLEEESVDSIYGVSAGALNGALLCQRKADKLISLWERTRRDDVWNTGPWQILKTVFGYRNGIFDPVPLLGILDREFDPDDAIIPFSAGAMNIQTGEFESFRIDPETRYTEAQKRKARRFTAASSAVPLAVTPIDIGGSLYADGGIRNVAPVGSAIDAGAERAIIILNSMLDKRYDTPESIIDVGAWAFDGLMNETLRSDVETAKTLNQFADACASIRKIDLTVIQPSKHLGNPGDFSRKEFKRRIAIGKKDAENAYA